MKTTGSLALAPAILALALFQPSRGLAAVTPVQVGDDFFSPANVMINQNDTVTWTWVGNIDHSSTSTSTPQLWNSGVHGKGNVFSFQFTKAGDFPYWCTVHTSRQTGDVKVNAAAPPPPVVAITSPTNNEAFFAPADFKFAATASSSGGTISKVQLFEGTTLLGTLTNSPYQLIVTNLGVGNYTLSAVATDNSNSSATNSLQIVVNAAIPLELSGAHWISATSFGFSYATETGATYAVDRTIDFATWTQVQTGAASGALTLFTDTNAVGGLGFYRVRHLETP
jgi:plastocyanin